tara:strand:- start:3026 stop:3583 length:558 start_codon:yes stop_codon:yes gene_type:complete
MNIKLKLIIFGVTAFLLANTYYDGKYMNMLMGWKKYYKMATIAFGGLSLYLFIKKHPNESKSAVLSATNLVKYMPIDSDTADFITPFFASKDKKNFNNINMSPQMKRMLHSGKGTVSRSVSETKKKYVASNQGWKCASCGNMLGATFEVDHKRDLQFGGTNHVDNLAALCPNCHRDKGVLQKISQ